MYITCYPMYVPNVCRCVIQCIYPTYIDMLPNVYTQRIYSYSTMYILNVYWDVVQCIYSMYIDMLSNVYTQRIYAYSTMYILNVYIHMLSNVYAQRILTCYPMYIHNVYIYVTQCIWSYTLCTQDMYIWLHLIIHWVAPLYTLGDVSYTLGNIHVTQCIYVT